MIPRSPLDAWIARQISPPEGRLSRGALERWQLVRLNGALRRARERSPFYRRLLADAPLPLAALQDLALLPFTSQDDLRAHGPDMLCVPGRDVARIITLQSSGTTGAPKRMHFTAPDLEQTVDFFHHGMSALVSPGQLVAVLMPGQRPGTVGELLGEGLGRMRARCEVPGLVRNVDETLGRLLQLQPDCLVGLPVQALALARHPAAASLRLSSVLLSADHVPESLTTAVSLAFGCPVFSHWGMSETGLGGAVECRARAGMHPREADLLLEVVDPASGSPLADGEWGELVVTTLTRQGMPLFRYRTGDEARMLAGPCPCGSVLRRLDRVRGRLAERILIGQRFLGMPQLEEPLFALPWLADFRATLRQEGDRTWLNLDLNGREPYHATARQDTARALAALVKDHGGALALGDVRLCSQPLLADGPIKRRLEMLPATSLPGASP